MEKVHRTMDEALKLLPPRKPRGSPGNLIRAFILPYLVVGYPYKEARRLAREKALNMLDVIIEEG